MKSKFVLVVLLVLLSSLAIECEAQTQAFVHPGGLHTLADLDRVKAKVAAGEQPWKDAWDAFIRDGKAQSGYVASPQTQMGGSGYRQQAARDARAAYYNAIRWYISGDTQYAECSRRILNAYTAKINTYDWSELFMLPLTDFALAGEVLRIYPGWPASEFTAFQTMIGNHYTLLRDWLAWDVGGCPNMKPASWTGPAVTALIYVGILCDRRDWYDEAVYHYKYGPHQDHGIITNAIPFVYDAEGIAQPEESGRDQSHNQLGMYYFAIGCQAAWNQGDDLYGFADNRLLKGMEYNARFNLGYDVPYTPYNDCVNSNMCYISYGVRGALIWPGYEMVYNHYCVLKGIDAPYIKTMTTIMRPEWGSDDCFGYGTLLYTLSSAASTYATTPPPAPTGLIVTPGVKGVDLKWNPPPKGTPVSSYTVYRSETSGSGYSPIFSTTHILTNYWDGTASVGKIYYYKVQSANYAGASALSEEVQLPSPAVDWGNTLPSGWANTDIGEGWNSSTLYAPVQNNSFLVTTSSSGIDGTWDKCQYAFAAISGDTTLICRIGYAAGDRAGIMIRESLSPDSRDVVMTLGKPSIRNAQNAIRFNPGNRHSWWSANAWTGPQGWFKITRTGNTFRIYQSGDGITWVEMRSADVSMGPNCYAGIFVCGYSVQFDNVSIVTNGSAPAAPTGLNGTALSSTRINLTWTASPNATYYTIKRASTSGGPYTTIADHVVLTTYTDTNLTPSTNYYYVVSATNLKGMSPDSSELTTATRAQVIPLAPTGLVATAGNAHVDLSWNWTDELTTSYNIKRAETPGGPYTTIGSSTTTSFTDTTAANGTTYYYVVSAVNIIGEGPNSIEASATPSLGQYSYWPCDETTVGTLTDVWSGRNGTVGAGGTSVAGKYGKALRLDGTSTAFVTLPAGIVSSLTECTISAWVNLTSVDQWARIFDFGTDTTNYMFLSPRNGSNRWRFAITTGSGEQGIDASVSATANVWTHVAVTMSGNSAVLYINGVEKGRNSSMTLNPSSLGNTTLNYIGDSQWTGDPLLKGSIDDFRIFSSALTAAQISSLYSATSYPSAPKSLTATPGNYKVKLTWNNAAEVANNYVIKRSVVSGGPYIPIGTSYTTSYTDTTVVNGTTYYYVVCVAGVRGEGPDSAEVSATPGPQKHAYWSLDKSMVDSWSGRNITSIGAGTWQTPGKYGDALSLSGANTAYATLPAGLVSSLTDFTFSAWVKPTSIKQWERVFDFGSGTKTYMFLGYCNTTGTMRYAIINTSTTSEQRIDSSVNIPTGSWSHIAITWSNNVGIMYVNGVEVGRNSSMTFNPSSLGNTTANYLGKSQWNDPYWNGSIDEVKIYADALTPDQIANLYNTNAL